MAVLYYRAYISSSTRRSYDIDRVCSTGGNSDCLLITSTTYCSLTVLIHSFTKIFCGSFLKNASMSVNALAICMFFYRRLFPPCTPPLMETSFKPNNLVHLGVFVLHPREPNNPRYAPNRRLGGHRAGPGPFQKVKIFLCRESNRDISVFRRLRCRGLSFHYDHKISRHYHVCDLKRANLQNSNLWVRSQKGRVSCG